MDLASSASGPSPTSTGGRAPSPFGGVPPPCLGGERGGEAGGSAGAGGEVAPDGVPSAMPSRGDPSGRVMRAENSQLPVVWGSLRRIVFQPLRRWIPAAFKSKPWALSASTEAARSPFTQTRQPSSLEKR